MARYRIGNDMTIIWSVTNKDGSSFPLAGKEVHLYYTCERGRFEADIQIQDNVVAWGFAGRDQRVLGGYTLTLEVIQPGGKRIIRKDICNAFTLVGKGCEENDTPGDADINEGGEITLVSELDVYKIQPIIPTVGSNSNWFVDGADTGKPSTGKSAYEYAKEKGYEGTESEYAESLKLAPENAEKLTELSAEVNEVAEKIGNINPAPMVSVTYAELVALRDNGEMVAGMQYRITDFVTTTAQENTRSAGHQFDVIVTADNENTLNEVARACLHDGDTYFSEAGASLAAWQIWYSLDNDAERFAWTDTENGKGVIYRMIDEWNNDCPYDFKNIQFKRFAVIEYDKVPSLVVDNKDNYYGYYYGALDLFGNKAIEEATYGEDFVWVYTFALKDLATDTWHDYTILNSIGLTTEESVIITCHSNVIKEHRDEYLGEHGRKAIWLNNIVFFNCYDDISSPDYSECYSYCNSNSFGNGCSSNSFGNGCSSNSFGNGCSSNSFGNGCSSNSFGNDCYSNSFGNDCYSNSFGNMCRYNSFGNGCEYNSFGNDCYSNSFEDNDGIAELVRYTRLDDGVYSIRFYHDNSKGDYQSLQNHHICRGVHHTSVELYDSRDYETTYAMTSNGGIREFVLADLKAS